MEKQMFYVPINGGGHRLRLDVCQQLRLKANGVFFYPCGDPKELKI